MGTLKKNTEEMEKEVEQMKQSQKNIEDSITDLKCRSMENNLLFYGLAEYNGNRRENCVRLINDFCETELETPNVRQQIERAHRIGQLNRENTNPRPIVVKFSTFRERERIRKKATKLSSTPYRIQEQYPKEIYEQRKQLYPKLNEASYGARQQDSSKTN
ncbi:uncharacterized protein LOC134269280 [Saccostrea cucullata]|uniref:uncharacterized protein LOC134269280 n=1 Tax=Saccostrea cuccullata TaxID=36930 RepID=UPI002ED0E4F3